MWGKEPSSEVPPSHFQCLAAARSWVHAGAYLGMPVGAEECFMSSPVPNLVFLSSAAFLCMYC